MCEQDLKIPYLFVVLWFALAGAATVMGLVVMSDHSAYSWLFIYVIFPLVLLAQIMIFWGTKKAMGVRADRKFKETLSETRGREQRRKRRYKRWIRKWF